MANLFPCPNCRNTFDLPDSVRGKTLRCPTCKHQFTAPLGDSAPNASGEGYKAPVARPPITVRPPVSPAVPPLSPSRPPARPEMRIQERPRPAAPQPPIVDLEASEPPSSRKRSRKQRSNSTSVAAVLLIGGAAALLLLIGIGVGVWMLVRGVSSGSVADGSSGFIPAAPDPGGPVADIPDVPGLRYRWQGAPNIYHVRVELDRGDHLEVHDGDTWFTAKPIDVTPKGDGDDKGQGTGFVINPDGYLLTCHHVVADTTKIEVTLGDKKYPARVVYSNRSADMAILHIDAHDLPTLSLADSDKVELGQDVWALGFPLSFVLGQSIKVTRGTLSGVTTKAGRKQFQIDAAVNFGNSGGPLVSETGLVLGIVSSKLASGLVSNVAWARAINDARQILAAKNVAYSMEGWTTKLDGPALVKRVSAATAYIEVTLGKHADADLFDLKTSGRLDKSNQPKPGANGALSSVQAGAPADGEILVDSSGDVIIANGGVHMPYLLGNTGKFLIDALPDDDRTTWEHNSEITITERREAPREHAFGPPGFPRMPRGPFGPNFPGMPGRREPEPEVITRTGEVHIVYTRVGVEGDVITIRKKYEMKVPPSAQSNSSVTMTGDGEVAFDAKLGIPRHVQFKATLSENIKGVSVSIPITVTCSLVEGAERDKRLHPPSPPPNQQAKNGGNAKPSGGNNANTAGGGNRSALPPWLRRDPGAMFGPVHAFGRESLAKVIGSPPPSRSADVTIPLSEPVGQVVAGGGDRFLILQLPEKKELAVLDLKESKVVKSIPVTDPDVLIAADMEELVLYLPATKQFQRWSLKSLTQVGASVASPISTEIKTIALGSASAGPLVVHAPSESSTTRGIMLFDPIKFTRLTEAIDPIESQPIGLEENPNRACVACSADGNLIVIVGKPRKLTALRRDGQRWVSAEIHGTYSLPSSDGQWIIDQGQSFSPDGSPQGQSRYERGHGVWCVPALADGWTLSLNEAKVSEKSRESFLKAMVHMGSDPEPIFDLPFNIDALKDLVDTFMGRFCAFERHIFLAPKAGCLAVIPKDGKRVELYRLKMDELMKNSNRDYLLVVSKPPEKIKHGSELRYQIVTKSKNGGLSHRLLSGPKGVKLSVEGLLTWTPPADTADGPIEFSVAIRDSSGREVTHSFRVRVEPK